MKSMWKNGEYKAVHTCQVEQMLAHGWSFKQELNHVRKEAKAKEESTKEAKKEKLTETHKKALELGLEIYDGDSKLIHHKTLGKIIKEALEDGENKGPAS